MKKIWCTKSLLDLNTPHEKDQKSRHETDPTLTQQQKIYNTRIQKKKSKTQKNSYWEEQENTINKFTKNWR